MLIKVIYLQLYLIMECLYRLWEGSKQYLCYFWSGAFVTSGITRVPCLYLCTQFICTSCNTGSESIGRRYVTVCLGPVAVDYTAYPFLQCVWMRAFLALGMEKTFLSWSCWLLEQVCTIFKSLPEGFLVLYSSLCSKKKPWKTPNPNHISSSCKPVANQGEDQNSTGPGLTCWYLLADEDYPSLARWGGVSRWVFCTADRLQRDP